MKVRGSAVVYWVSFVLYLVLGWILAVHYKFLLGDALSRVQSAQDVLLGRDPHLAAIGFIFTPLTALVEIPLTGLSPWIPEMTRYGMAGVVMSALFMAGAATQIWRIGADRGAPRWLQVAVTVAFVVNPMIVFYAVTGMSEAPFVFLMCWGIRRLIRWTSSDDVHDLIAAGLALGLSYLTRYDAAVPIAVAALFVGAVTWRRAVPHAWRSALLDAVIVVAPGVLAVVTWSVTSWLLTGDVLAQISSSYGNAAILGQSGGPATTGLSTLPFSLVEMLVLAPALPLLVPVVWTLAVRRRDIEVLVPTLLLGSVLAFQTYAYASGTTFGFLRFYIAAIPLLCIYALQIAPARGQVPARRRGLHAQRRRERLPALRWASGAAAAALVIGLPVTLVAMSNPDLSVQQFALRTLFDPGLSDHDRELHILSTFQTERDIADHLDAMHLPPGSVLMDSVYGFAVMAASDNPKQFVTPANRDFVSILGDPSAHGVKYILAVPNSGRGVSDAINRRFPTLYDNGGQVATLQLDIPNVGENQPPWRLYHVVRQPQAE